MPLAAFLLCNRWNGQMSGGGIYFKKKFLRIYPELWIAFAINTVLIYLLYGFDISWKDKLVYAVTQLTFFQFYTGDWCRGYGVGTPNGALWTISIMIQFYILVYVLYRLLQNWTKKRTLLFAAFCCLLGIVSANLQMLPPMWIKLLSVSVIPYLYLFVCGMCIYQYRDQFLPILVKYVWGIGGLYLLAKLLFTQIEWGMHWGINYDVVSSILLSMFIIGIGCRYSVPRMKHEISYSIFLYHMIFVNVVLELAKKYSIELSKYGVVMLLGTIAVTIAVAFASTYLNQKIVRRLE